jgi:hypothetical protein
VFSATIDPLTLAATAAVIVSAEADATIGAITLSATAAGAAARSRDGVYPLWWRAYVQRILGERALADEKARQERELWLAEHEVIGDGFVVGPAPIAHGEAEHTRPPDDEIAALTAVALLLTDAATGELENDFAEMWDEAVRVHPDEEAAIAAAMSFLLHVVELENA